MSKKEIDQLEIDYTNHKREYMAIAKQDGPGYAWSIKGKILRRIFDKLKQLREK